LYSSAGPFKNHHENNIDEGQIDFWTGVSYYVSQADNIIGTTIANLVQTHRSASNLPLQVVRGESTLWTRGQLMPDSI